MTVMGALRFLVGATLVATGVPLVTPLATSLVRAAWTGAPATAGVMSAAPLRPDAIPMPAQPSAPSEAFGGNAATVAADDTWAVPPPLAADSGGGLQLDRSPPPPPTPLPPAPHELGQSGPPLGAAYRSTLRVPPPDLLDAEGPPPAVPWAARAAAPPAASGGGAHQSPAATTVVVPATYRVRDGDDLATIAGRFYGHPAAAAAIWSANRDTISNPDLLPIGAELRLPPAWAVGGHGHQAAGAIEPAAYPRPLASGVAAGGPANATPAAPWLAPAPEQPPAATILPVVAPVDPPAAAASARLGPGETLSSLAHRLYGDPTMADAIFAANRDRLRSPHLVTAGMELRLPRPVTLPRP